MNERNRQTDDDDDGSNGNRFVDNELVKTALLDVFLVRIPLLFFILFSNDKQNAS